MNKILSFVFYYYMFFKTHNNIVEELHIPIQESYSLGIDKTYLTP